MFFGSTMLMPGQELRQFDVLRPETRETGRGQEVITGYTPIGTVKAILAQAKPEEIERWRQINHPITHKIIMRHKPPFDIRSGDIFERAHPDWQAAFPYAGHAIRPRRPRALYYFLLRRKE